MNLEQTLNEITGKMYGKNIGACTDAQLYTGVLQLTKEKMAETPAITGDKKVYYISMEFLIGKLLSNNLINLGIYEELSDILKKNGIDPQKDLTIDQSIDFGSTAAAFTGDDSAAYTVEFEPSATILEKEGAGHVVASLGEASGYVPYTSYSVKTSYMKENPEIIQKFTNALQKGMDYVQSHTPEEIAEVIAPQFKETDIDTITTIVKRYYDQDTWKENLIFKKDSFELLQDILEDAGELGERAEYEELVQTEYAKNAVKEK